MLNWTIEERKFKLRYNWKLSRNEAIEKTNFFINVSDGLCFGIGEIAPNIRYHETINSVNTDFSNFLKNPITKIDNLKSIFDHVQKLNASNAVKFGVESAAIHFLAKKNKISVTSLLNLPSIITKVRTCYTIPVMPLADIGDFIKTHNLERFESLKIKINEESGFDTIREVNKYYSKNLKIDANEAFTDVDKYLLFEKKIIDLNIDFIEQPFPVSFIDEYKFIKNRVVFKIFADESIQDKVDYVSIAEQFHGVNIKLMKTGGYINAIRLISEAKTSNLKTMIGCMVETTLGISSAMNLASLVDYADLDGHFLIEDEPFKLINEFNGNLTLK